jgi:hypothetical protein
MWRKVGVRREKWGDEQSHGPRGSHSKVAGREPAGEAGAIVDGGGCSGAKRSTRWTTKGGW